MNPIPLRLGTRGSLLARTQTDWVAAQLRAQHPERAVEIVIIETTGDLRRDVPFAQVGTKGMFVKEIEQALLNGTVDVGIHSLKDMPGSLPEGLEIACVPAREDPRDALLSRKGATLKTLPPGAVVGTSSVRRQAQLRVFRQDLHLTELRGNLDTRLRKLEEGQYDAIVLACAGLNRLGLSARITEHLAPEICLPAVGQGALALETRRDDRATQALLAPLNDTDSAVTVLAERGFQRALQGGCSIPAGALATVAGEKVTITGLIAAPDGSLTFWETRHGTRSEAEQLGVELAESLLAQGGRALLDALGPHVSPGNRAE